MALKSQHRPDGEAPLWLRRPVKSVCLTARKAVVVDACGTELLRILAQRRETLNGRGEQGVATFEAFDLATHVARCVNACAGVPPGYQRAGLDVGLLLQAYEAAEAFIESHVGDPDITATMRANYARLQDARKELRRTLPPTPARRKE